MKGFKIFMRLRKYATATIEMNCKYINEFKNWLLSENMTVETVTYNDILAFVDFCRNNENSWSLTNHKLLAVRHYYNHLQKSKNIKNPAAGIVLKGKTKRVINNILNKKQLEDLFESYKIKDNRTLRNKIILGLLIYQGLTTEELHLLKPEFIKLKDGKIIIPETKRSNGRTLKLNANQIVDLSEYLTKTRNEIIEKSGKPTNQLLISSEGNENIKASLHHLFVNLKKINPAVKDPKQIRKSVIVNWLKVHNLREVQYFAGHKWISSTERYQMENLEDLQKEVEKYHPLKK
jgi:integrase/recombinase XerD